MEAYVEIVYGFETAALSFGRIRQDETKSKTTYLAAKAPEALELEELTSSSDYVTVKVVDQSDDKEEENRVVVEITVLPGLPAGRLSETVTAKSKIDTLQPATIRVSATVIGEVEMSPETIRFLVMNGEDGSVMPDSHNVKITNHSNTRMLKISSVKDPDDRVELNLRTVEEGKSFELIVRPKDASAVDKAISGTITIVTDHHESKELKVRYFLTPQKSSGH